MWRTNVGICSPNRISGPGPCSLKPICATQVCAKFLSAEGQLTVGPVISPPTTSSVVLSVTGDSLLQGALTVGDYVNAPYQISTPSTEWTLPTPSGSNATAAIVIQTHQSLVFSLTTTSGETSYTFTLNVPTDLQSYSLIPLASVVFIDSSVAAGNIPIVSANPGVSSNQTTTVAVTVTFSSVAPTPTTPVLLGALYFQLSTATPSAFIGEAP